MGKKNKWSGKNNSKKSRIFHSVSWSPISSISSGAAIDVAHWWQEQEQTSCRCTLSPYSAWLDSSSVTAGMQTALHMACEPLHLIARGNGVICPQSALAQSDSHFFSGSYRNWRRRFSLCTEGSTQQGGSVEWQCPIKHSTLSLDNL